MLKGGKNMKNSKLVQRILLGLLILIPGLLKLLVSGPAGVTGMLSGNFLFSWAPAFWAWVLIIGEILAGIAILANWKIKYTALVPAFILIIAVLTTTIRWSDLGSTGWSSVLLHLVAIWGYLTLACDENKKR